MRRNDREITEFSEMTDVMKRCDVCRLALNDEDGYPYLLPLNFGMEETDGRVTLYFHGAKEGKKYDVEITSFEDETLEEMIEAKRQIYVNEIDVNRKNDYINMNYEIISNTN